MQHLFEALRGNYEKMIAGMVITRPQAVHQAVARVETSLGFYKDLSAAVNVPTVMLGAIDYREDDCDPTRGIGQGDRWDRKSVNVPKGCGPFASRKAADIFYVRYDHLDRPPVPYAEGGLAVACFEEEGYNGWGYNAHGRRSPYIAGGTNFQQVGKYTSDGHWDPDHMDEQIGTLPIMVELIRLHPELAFGLQIISSPGVPGEVTPLPVTFRGATVTGATWVQASLNKLHAVPPDIAPLDEDGNYGRNTRAAVRAFQISNGLDPDGIAGDLTCAKIDELLAKGSA